VDVLYSQKVDLKVPTTEAMKIINLEIERLEVDRAQSL
jgi:hypothetical protein